MLIKTWRDDVISDNVISERRQELRYTKKKIIAVTTLDVDEVTISWSK